MNQINIIGRVGADPELKHTPSGKAVLNLNLAVDDGYGENRKTVWVEVTIWAATAETAAKYVRKGHRLGISGRLSQESWEDKEGNKRSKVKITCEAMHLLTDKRSDEPAWESAEPAAGRYAERRSPNQNGATPPPDMDDEGEDVPF